MELTLNSNDSVYANANVVFDESLLQLTDDREFVLNVTRRFNASVTFPSWAERIRISGGSSFNYPINLPSTLSTLENCFRGCSAFNQSITIPEGVTSCADMFYGCERFNQPITIPNSVNNCFEMFSNCNNFNSPVTLSSQTTNCYRMFANHQNFNQPVTIPLGMTKCWGLFSGCWGYNQRVDFPYYVNYCEHVFAGCYNYNQSVIFEGADDVAGAFGNCIRFNSSVVLRGTIRNSVNMFFNCFIFNRPVILQEGVVNSYNMLTLARRFNSVVIIPKTAQRIYNMFMNINGAEFNFDNGYFGPPDPDSVLQKPIYIAANSIVGSGATNLFGNVYSTASTNSNINLYITGIQNNFQFSRSFRNNGAHILNIFTDDAGQNLLYNTYLLTNGGKPTWTVDADNGRVYNASMNIHIYNNWDGVIPTGDGYHLLRYYSSNGQELYYNEYIESGYSGGFRFGSCEWSNVPNGAPVTEILDNIQEDKNLYYAGTSLPYVRQMWGAVLYDVEPNKRVSAKSSRIYNFSGIIFNGQQIAGVSYKNVTQAGICYRNASLPSLAESGIGRTSDYSTNYNGMYYTDPDKDIYLQPTAYAFTWNYNECNRLTEFVVTYRDGNVPNGGVRFITRYNYQASDLSHNTGINVKVGNNSNVYVDGDTLNGAHANFGCVNLSYGEGEYALRWGVWALAPVTDGINNYNTGDRIRYWEDSDSVAFTVWPR